MEADSFKSEEDGMKLLMESWRQHLKGLIYEQPQSEEKYLYRGMTLDMPNSLFASHLRKLATDKPTTLNLDEDGVARIILKQIKDRGVGESWTTSQSVAANFADAWGAKNSGKKLHFIFVAKVPEEAGYDPQAADEEPGMFYDEQEVAFKKGEEIPITAIRVFIDDGETGRLHLKFRKVWAGPPMTVKA